MNLKPIHEQVVLVLGATSGIGRETALRFAERGAKVVVAGRSLPALAELVHEIRLGGGEGAGWLHRLAPNLADWLLSRLGYRPQLTDQPKTDQAPHNLYEHLEGYDRVHGPFNQEARSTSIYTGLEIHPGLRWGLLALLAGVGGLGPAEAAQTVS